MNKSVCDIVNPNCIVKSCCSQVCEEVKDEISKMTTLENCNHLSYEMIDQQYCPVCHNNRFCYMKDSALAASVLYNKMKVYIHCLFCNITYNINLTKPGILANFKFKPIFKITSIYNYSEFDILEYQKSEKVMTIAQFINYSETIHIDIQKYIKERLEI